MRLRRLLKLCFILTFSFITNFNYGQDERNLYSSFKLKKRKVSILIENNSSDTCFLPSQSYTLDLLEKSMLSIQSDTLLLKLISDSVYVEVGKSLIGLTRRDYPLLKNKNIIIEYKIPKKVLKPKNINYLILILRNEYEIFKIRSNKKP